MCQLAISQDDTKPTTVERGLPASWYRSASLYELERRAIFSRQWLLLTHVVRLANVGDFTTFTFAGFAVAVTRDQQSCAQGYYIACSLGASSFIEASCDNVGILTCTHTGEGSQTCLVPVHTKIDKAGFVWVNIQAGEPDINWEEQFAEVESHPHIGNIDLRKEFCYDHTWDMEVDCNWKVLIDNYNECYHCPTAHPLIAAVSDLTKYRVQPRVGAGWMEHTIVNKADAEEQFRRSILFLLPASSVTTTGDFFYIQNMFPLTATTSRLTFEIYRHKNATDKNFADITAFYRQVLEEDKDLCNGAQKGILGGVYINGELHPEKEKGLLYFQQFVRRELREYRAKELRTDRRTI